MTIEQKEYAFKGILIVSILMVLFNLVFIYSMDYVTITDNNFIADGYETFLTVKYSDLFSQESSISKQITSYLMEDSEATYGSDSATYEKLGFLCVVIGSALLGIGAYIFFKRKDFKLILAGALACCVGTIILNVLIQKIEEEIQKSFIGNLGMLFGASLIFESNAGVYMICSLLFIGALALLCYFYTRKIDENESEEIENDEQ